MHGNMASRYTNREMCQVLICLLAPNPSHNRTEMAWPSIPLERGGCHGDSNFVFQQIPKVVPHMTPLSYAHGDWGLCT
jgi:hypothetical protein